jgi:DNA-binding transcriptional MerR regulator
LNGGLGGIYMEEWLSVSQLSKMLEIPETTTRRYLNNFEEYFRSEQIGRGKKYHPSSIEILQRIAMLYDSDRETIEIKKILADEYAFELEETNDTTTQPPAYDIPGKFEEFQRKQEEFNKKLLERLQEQQKHIKQLADNRDAAIHELKRLSSPNEKRMERFEQIMTEHKVRRILEKLEALKLWDEKPEEERIKKVGLFRKEEDKDKRDLFIKDYIDEHFEVCLKKEFEI